MMEFLRDCLNFLKDPGKNKWALIGFALLVVAAASIEALNHQPAKIAVVVVFGLVCCFAMVLLFVAREKGITIKKGFSKWIVIILTLLFALCFIAIIAKGIEQRIRQTRAAREAKARSVAINMPPVANPPAPINSPTPTIPPPINAPAPINPAPTIPPPAAREAQVPTATASRQIKIHTLDPKGSLPLLSSQPFWPFPGDEPPDGVAQELNPPVFNWGYITDPLNESEYYMCTPRTFLFQLSTNSNFSTLYWDIATSNNYYNFLPPITNSDGSNFTGTNYWRVIYYDSKMVSVLATGAVHNFTLAATATNWDRSMLADSNYLYSALSPHPHLYFWATNRDAVSYWLKNKYISCQGNSWPVFTNWALGKLVGVTSPWWTNEDVFNKTPSAFNNLTYLPYISIVYQLDTNSFISNSQPGEMMDIIARYWMKNNLDRQDPYNINVAPVYGLAIGYDHFYDLMTPAQRRNVLYALEQTLRFYFNEDWWFSGSGADPTRTYSYNTRMMGVSGAGKDGYSHQRFAAGCGLAICMAIWNDSAVAREYFPYFMNYMIAIKDCGRGDEGRNYNNSTGFRTDRNFAGDLMSIMGFPQAKLQLNPWYNKLASFYGYEWPVAYRGTGNPWGDYGYGAGLSPWAAFNEFYYRHMYTAALITQNGAVLRQFKRYNTGSCFDNPQFEAITGYYFQEPPEADWQSTAYMDVERGYAIAGSHQPNDWAAFTNGIGFVTAARPGSCEDHRTFGDGAIQFWAYGAQISAGGSSSEKHMMDQSGTVFVDGIGTCSIRGTPITDVAARFIGFTNTPDYTYIGEDTTEAYNRVNFRDLGGQTFAPAEMYWPFYSYEANKRPYLVSMQKHILFPHRKYLVLYDTMMTTQPAHFQWLWQYMEPTGVVNTNSCSFTYTCTNLYNMSNVTVYVQPIVNPSLMTLTNLPGSNYYEFNPFTGERNPFAPGHDPVGDPWPNGHIWVYNTTATTNWHFGWVIYPVQWGHPPPTITRINDYSVNVQEEDNNDTITINPTNTLLPFTLNPTGSNLGTATNGPNSGWHAWPGDNANMTVTPQPSRVAPP